MREWIEKIISMRPIQLVCISVVALVFLFIFGLTPAVTGHKGPEYVKAWWQVPGYNIVIGFGVALVWVKSVKWLGKHYLQQPDELEDVEVDDE